MVCYLNSSSSKKTSLCNMMNYWQRWWIEILVWESEHFTIRSIPLTLNIQNGVTNDVVEAWYSICWWVGIIKSFHAHDNKYSMHFLESVKNNWIFMHSTFLPMKIGWNLEMFTPFLENAHGINFKFIKVFNKVSLLKMLIFKIEFFFLIMTIGVANDFNVWLIVEHVICHVQKLTNLSRECSNARNYKRDHLLVTCKTTNVKSHILEIAIRSIFRRFNFISYANKHNDFGKTFFLWIFMRCSILMIMI